MTVSNAEFAERVKCHMTMSSRLRNGLRMPSVTMINKIAVAFDIPTSELVAAHQAGRAAFGKFLRDRVFNADHPPKWETPASERETESESVAV